MDIQAFLSHFSNVIPAGKGWLAQCPDASGVHSHGDSRQSLSISEGNNGSPVFNCHVPGCADDRAGRARLLQCVGLSFSQVCGSDSPHGLNGKRRKSDDPISDGYAVKARYEYRDETGTVRYRVVRLESTEIHPTKGKPKKTFKQQRHDPSRGWIGGLGKDVPKLLYCLPELIAAHPSEWVYIPEGEGKVDLLRSWGLVATCQSDGATSTKGNGFPLSWSSYFVGRKVCLLQDNDKAGEKNVAAIYKVLKDVVAEIVVLLLPGLPPAGDVGDWAAAGGTRAQLEFLRSTVTTAFVPVDEDACEREIRREHLEKEEKDDDEIAEALEIDVQGQDEKHHIHLFSYHRKKWDYIDNIDRLSVHKLVQLCGPPARLTVADGDTFNSSATFPLKRIKNALSALGTPYIADGTRLGAGVWEARQGSSIDGTLLVNGSSASVLTPVGLLEKIERPRYGTRWLDFGASDDWYDHDDISAMLASYSPAWASSVAMELEGIFNRWCFGEHQEITPALLAGLTMATWVQSIWDWRPQVYIRGESNTGKTTLFDFLTGNEESQRLGIFGRLALSSGDTTVAALAQFSKNKSLAVVIDELEGNSESARRRKREMVEFFRNSGRGQSRRRGGSHGTPTSTVIKHIVWSASTQTGLTEEMDKNRYIVIDLLSPPSHAFGKLKSGFPGEAQIADLGQRVLAVSVKLALASKDYAAKLFERRPVESHPRLAESFSVPAAMYAMATGMADNQADELLARMLLTIQRDYVTPDWKRALNDICDYLVKVDVDPISQRTTEVAVRDELAWLHSILGSLHQKSHELDRMSKYGIIPYLKSSHPDEIWIDGEELCVMLVCTQIQSNVFRGKTQWSSGDLSEVLQRVPGSRVPDNGKRIRGGPKLYGVIVPFSKMLDVAKNFDTQLNFSNMTL